MCTLDTNILIYYAAVDPKVTDFISEQFGPFYISTISVTEFLAYPKLTAKDRKFFLNLAEQLDLVPVSFDISLTAAEIKGKYGLKLGDAIIAATAVATRTTLITRNASDFKKIPELKVLVI